MRLRRSLVGVALAGVALGAGCTQPNPGYQPDPLDAGGDLARSDRQRPVSDRGVPLEAGADRAPPPPGKPIGVDVLFVVDNSPGMATPQKWLARDLAALIGAGGIDALPGGPSLRIGVISTDVGVGPHANSNCTATGDKGKLLVRSGCAAPTGGAKYLERIGTSANYTPPLVDRLACMLQLGESGCGFEQPLESLRLALEGANPGFLRAEAALAVIVLSNEDDCSAATTSLFDPKEVASYGPYTSYRCFQHGVLCGGKQPPLAPTLLSGCQPGGSALHEVKTRYLDFLLGLKPPGWVSVLVIAAQPKSVISVVQVEQQPPYWYVDASCQSSAGVKGDPAFRLYQLSEGLGARGGFSSICADSYSAALKGLVARVQAAF